MFLESTGIDRLDAPIDTINGDLGRSQADDRPKSFMGRLNSPVILAAEPLPEYPRRRYRSTPMSVGDLRERRNKGRVYDAFVDDQNDNDRRRERSERESHREKQED